MDIKIGCDPEFFVKKNGEFVSAFGLVEGTKSMPTRVKNGAVQVDGMALEFNISPATNAKQFLDNINSVLTQFRDIIPNDYLFAFTPVAPFSLEYMATQPPEATALGCTPDYNAWTGKINPKPHADVPFRTASGHIHIGWTEDTDPLDPEHFEACCMLTKQLDQSLGLAERFWDMDTQRKALYGARGAFRPKPYGVEYRVLSNAWLSTPDLISFIYDATDYVTQELKRSHVLYQQWEGESYNYRDAWYLVEHIFSNLAAYQRIRPLLMDTYKKLEVVERTKRDKYLADLLSPISVSNIATPYIPKKKKPAKVTMANAQINTFQWNTN